MDGKEKHIRELFPRLNDIKDLEIRKKVISVWLEAWQESEFENIADMSQWEPQKDVINLSNVEHTNQVVECAIAIARVVQTEQGIAIDMDTLMAAALLHDVDKLLMFAPQTGKTTPIGNFLPHTGIGSYLALRADLPLRIVHAIAAHSPNYSSIPPKTIEAVILYHADLVLTETWRTAKNIDISFDLKP